MLILALPPTCVQEIAKMVRVTRSMARLNRLAVGEIDSQVSKANLIPGSPRGRKSTRVEECPRTPETVNVRSVVVTPPPRSSSSRVGDEEEEGWPVGVGEVDDFDDADVTSRASGKFSVKSFGAKSSSL